MRWLFPSPPPEDIAKKLETELGLRPLTARLLAARGLNTPELAQAFLHPALSHLHSPFAMLGLRAALERLEAAIARREKVLIYGDYDVDGTVAIVILKTAIELCGGAADFHVPHRIRDGYGMKEEVIERAAAEGVRLVISVDTGIRAFAAAEAAARCELDLIVTDHHLPNAAEGVPRALAVLNPNQPGCDYPCKALCGAGVAFKLAQALLEKNGRERLLPSFLKMVAMATIADAVALTGENRVFARLGLDGLRSPVNAGLKALMEVAAVGGRRLVASDVGFRLAPRLNAAGRMDVAREVIELFTVRDPERAREIAARLNQLNQERQQEEQRILEEAQRRIESDDELRNAFCLVVDGDGWHRGVIGIVATRIVERYGKPTLVLARDNGEAYGSGRSIHAFHLLDALESCRELFTRYGGHAHAVGFSLPCERVPQLRRALDAHARTCLTPADFEPTLEIDSEIALDEVTPQLYRELELLEPFGMGNPEPVFAARRVRLATPPRLLKDIHVKLRLAQERDGRVVRAFDALGWRMAEQLSAQCLAGDLLDVAFTLDHNDHPEFGGLQLVLCDVQKGAQAAG